MERGGWQDAQGLQADIDQLGAARLFPACAGLSALTIACALCYGGSYFIAHTIALGDLILNCVALEVRI